MSDFLRSRKHCLCPKVAQSSGEVRQTSTLVQYSAAWGNETTEQDRTLLPWGGSWSFPEKGGTCPEFWRWWGIILARNGDGGGEGVVKEATHGGSTEVKDHRARPVLGSWFLIPSSSKRNQGFLETCWFQDWSRNVPMSLECLTMLGSEEVLKQTGKHWWGDVIGTSLWHGDGLGASWRSLHVDKVGIIWTTT